MKRVKLVVAYDGTHYCGWQFQLNGITIEEVLNKALSDLLREPITVIGASRTDSGVHALGNVAVFDTENRMPADKICLALNQRLPEDIRVQKSEQVPEDYHPRKQNCVKTYEYRILNSKIDMPTSRLYTHFCYVDLDVELMREAAAYLLGEHDFKSFCTSRSQAENTVRTIYSLDVCKEGDLICIRISGSGFLYNMVRIIAGTLMKVGMRVYAPEHIDEIIAARDRIAAGPKMSAKGLTLVSLEYETELRPEIIGDNKDWQYKLIQREVLAKGKAYLIIDRCVEEEWDRILLRMIHQSARNGAKQIFVCNRQDDNRLEEKAYGYYHLKHAYDFIRMRKSILPDTDPLKEVSIQILLVPVLLERFFDYEKIFNETFFSVDNSAAESQSTIRKRIGMEHYLMFFLKMDEEVIGIAELHMKESMVEIESIGILPQFQNRGLGRLAIDAISGFAVIKGKTGIELIVSTQNKNACSVYKKYGFKDIKVESRWYLAENTLK